MLAVQGFRMLIGGNNGCAGDVANGGVTDLLSVSRTDKPGKQQFLCLTEGSTPPVLPKLNASGDILESVPR